MLFLSLQLNVGEGFVFDVQNLIGARRKTGFSGFGTGSPRTSGNSLRRVRTRPCISVYRRSEGDDVDKKRRVGGFCRILCL